MSKITQPRPSTNAAVHRREFLRMAPFAVTAAAMPLGAALPPTSAIRAPSRGAWLRFGTKKKGVHIGREAEQRRED
jgi:hypothetical protein